MGNFVDVLNFWEFSYRKWQFWGLKGCHQLKDIWGKFQQFSPQIYFISFFFISIKWHSSVPTANFFKNKQLIKVFNSFFILQTRVLISQISKNHRLPTVKHHFIFIVRWNRIIYRFIFLVSLTKISNLFSSRYRCQLKSLRYPLSYLLITLLLESK